MSKAFVHALVYDISNFALHACTFMFIWNINHTSALLLGGLYLIKQVSFFFHSKEMHKRRKVEAEQLLKDLENSVLTQETYPYVQKEEQQWAESFDETLDEVVKAKDDSSKIH